MKKYTLFAAVYIGAIGYLSAQPPAGYYTAAVGKTGTALRIALYNKIKGHNVLAYSGLWSAYNTTDKKPGTNNIWDIYSDIPGGAAPYTFTYSSDQCSSGSASGEGDCYNREHIWPQSKFGSIEPMRTDLWIVYPTDAFVNMKRADYPYGQVGGGTWNSANGSKLGMNTYAGAPSTLSFEPHDSFKGDIARSYFYIATRYYSEDGGWANWEMAAGADLKSWTKKMLLEWHHLDPVSTKEIERNNAVFTLQGNRNPFIDHPKMADCVFGTADCTELLGIDKNDFSSPFELYPNPSEGLLQIKMTKNVIPKATVFYEIYDMMGRKLLVSESQDTRHTIDIHTLSNGNYLLRMQSGEEVGSVIFVKK